MRESVFSEFRKMEILSSEGKHQSSSDNCLCAEDYSAGSSIQSESEGEMLFMGQRDKQITVSIL